MPDEELIEELIEEVAEIDDADEVANFGSMTEDGDHEPEDPPPEPAPVEEPVEDLLRLSIPHDDHRLKVYNGLSIPAFVGYACNNPIVLLQTQMGPGGGIGYVGHLPGTLACRPGAFGWKRDIPFLLALQSPSDGDVDHHTALSDSLGAFLREQLKWAGIPLDECWVTHLCRFGRGEDLKKYSAVHKDACRPYLRADLLGCTPKMTIAFGTDVVKALWGKNAKLDAVRSGVQQWRGLNVVPTVSHIQFAVTDGGIEAFRQDLIRARDAACGRLIQGAGLTDYQVCTTVEQMSDAVTEMVETLKRRYESGMKPWLSFDTEFGNDVAHPGPWDYLLSMQFSTGPGHARSFRLRGEKGAVLWDETQLAEIRRIVDLLIRPDHVRLVGHHLRTDVQKLYEFGLDLDFKLETGVDTMLIHHALYGSDDENGLDQLVRKFCPWFGPYWKGVEDWLTANKRAQRLKFGYRDVPLDLLEPYGLLDADATYRCAEVLVDRLAEMPKLNEVYWTITQPCSLHLMDVQRQGVLVAQQQIKVLRDLYLPEYMAIKEELAELVRWPGFNPGSAPQVCSLLFSSTQHKGKKPVPLPEDNDGLEVRTLDLQPYCNTDKYPVVWDQIVAEGKQMKHAPCTKAKVLDILQAQLDRAAKAEGRLEDAQYLYEREVLKKLRQISVLGMFIRNYVKETQNNEYGVLKDGKGFTDNIWPDGRVRGNFQQLTSTGRYSCNRTNLQVAPKKQEAPIFELFVDRRFGLSMKEYNRRCDPEKCTAEELIPVEQRISIPKFKTAIVPAPGNVLIEADFSAAEMCVMAFCSGDEVMIKIIEQGRDMHGETATSAFQLDCADELAAALAELGDGKVKDGDRYSKWKADVEKRFTSQRIAAKAVTFGLMYGRGAGGLARELQSQGLDVTTALCQGIIDSFSKKFAKGWAWIQGNANSAIENGYVENPFGVRRYFPGVQRMNKTKQAAARREGSNSAIQGCLHAYTVIALQDGAVRIGDMENNQVVTVITPTGPRDAVMVPSGRKPIMLLRTSDGRAMQVTPDHILRVMTEIGYENRRVDQLRPGDVLDAPVVPPATTALPVVGETEYVGSVRHMNKRIETTLDENLAWFLGYFVGNGSATQWNAISFAFNVLDTDTSDHVNDLLKLYGLNSQSEVNIKEHGGQARSTYVGHGVLRKLFWSCGCELEKSAGKKIPTGIFESPPAVQMAFMDGYMSADGTVNPHGDLTYVTKSKQLAIDIGNLVAQMGFESRWFVDGKGYYRGSLSGDFAKAFKLSGGFKHHARRRAMLETRYDENRKRSKHAGTAFPHWLSLRMLPDVKPPSGTSAQTIWYRTLRGGELRNGTARFYEHLGFKPVNAVTVESVEPDGESETYDLSVITDKEDERWFIANGIQVHNCVGTLLSAAGVNLYRFRYRTEAGKRLGFQVLIPIHDAFLVECRAEVAEQVKQVLKMSMSTLNPIPGTGGRCLGVDIELYPNSWAEKAKKPKKAT